MSDVIIQTVRGVGVPGPQGPVADSMVVSQTDFTDSYRYYGGLVGVNWKINRYDTTTFIKTSATIANNPGSANLAAAWASRLTLTYA